MKRALDILDERKKIAHYYLELTSMTWLDMPSVDDENIHGYQSFPCMFEKSKVINILNSDNISDLETIRTIEMHIWVDYKIKVYQQDRQPTRFIHSPAINININVHLEIFLTHMLQRNALSTAPI